MGSAKEPFERLDVRTKWKDEARDFTPCIARKLDIIGKLIGKNLELVEEEKYVGTKKLDILAEETDTGTRVAIENQFNWSDDDHMTRLFLYSTGLDARIVIWIAEGFWHKHAEVLDRLNVWTKDGIEFYGLKFELVRKNADSAPELIFSKVVYPGGWDKKITTPDTVQDPETQKLNRFFEPLVNELCTNVFAEKRPKRMFGQPNGRGFPSVENDDIWYAASLEGKIDAWVTVHIRCEDDEMTKNLFDKLEAIKDQIESSVIADPEPEWHWRRQNRYSFSSINIRKDGSIDDPADKLEETRAWMLDLLPKLKEVFDPRIAALLADQQKCGR